MTRILVAYDRHHTLEPAARAACPDAAVLPVDHPAGQHVDALMVGLPGSAEINRRQRTHDKVAEMLNTHRPDFFLWENVRGLGSLRNEAILDAYLGAVIHAGYLVRYRTLEASRFGAQQPNRRMWIIGTPRLRDLQIEPRWPSRRNRQHIYAPDADPVALAILQANL